VIAAQATAIQRHIYRLLWLGLLLFLLHSGLLAWHWLQALSSDLFPDLLPFHGLRLLMIDTFFAAAGLYALAREGDQPRLKSWSLLWLTLGIVASVLALLNGQHELWRAIMACQALLLLALVGLLAYRRSAWSSVVLVWSTGMALHGAFLLVNAFDLFSTIQADVYLAQMPVALALMFWLMLRYSNITRAWAEPGLLVVVGWLLTAGALRLLDTSAFPAWAAWLAVAYSLLAYTVFAAHCYRALSDRNRTNTLAAHWHAVTVLALLLVTGYVGTAGLIPGADAQIVQTWIVDLPLMGAEIGFVALGLGLLNQIAAELRGHDRRVTGLLPLWTISAGWLLSIVTSLLTGTVQVFYARIGYSETSGDLLPLLRFLAAGHALVLVGALIYALGVYARRIRL
jgi:hypothetical protein